MRSKLARDASATVLNRTAPCLPLICPTAAAVHSPCCVRLQSLLPCLPLICGRRCCAVTLSRSLLCVSYLREDPRSNDSSK